MKEKMLSELYSFDKENNSYIVDVQLNDYRDAYSEWDFSPFDNRDLDYDLNKYLLECSYEIPFKYEILIKFHLLYQQEDKERESKSILGIYNYFKYEIRKLKNMRGRLLKETFVFLVIGTCLLFSGAVIEQIEITNVLKTMVKEGLLIGGWVMIWEMFSAWFFSIRKLNTKIKHYLRLSNAKIEYSYRKNDCDNYVSNAENQYH